VSDSRVLSGVLEEMKLEYDILSDTQADVYAEVPITRLTLALAERDCIVLSIREKDESLESYYMNLIGGVRK